MRITVCSRHLAKAVNHYASTTTVVQVRQLSGFGHETCPMSNALRGRPCGAHAYYLVEQIDDQQTCYWCDEKQKLVGINGVWACAEHVPKAMEKVFAPFKQLREGL